MFFKPVSFSSKVTSIMGVTNLTTSSSAGLISAITGAVSSLMTGKTTALAFPALSVASKFNVFLSFKSWISIASSPLSLTVLDPIDLSFSEISTTASSSLLIGTFALGPLLTKYEAPSARSIFGGSVSISNVHSVSISLGTPKPKTILALTLCRPSSSGSVGTKVKRVPFAGTLTGSISPSISSSIDLMLTPGRFSHFTEIAGILLATVPSAGG